MVCSSSVLVPAGGARVAAAGRAPTGRGRSTTATLLPRASIRRAGGAAACCDAPAPSLPSAPALLLRARRVACCSSASGSSGGEPQQQQQQAAAAPPAADNAAAAAAAGEDFEGLAPEDDMEVPGTYFDALNGNTKLGKAVKAAVQELEHLGELEHDVLGQCDDLLKQLGMKGSLFGGAGAGAGNPLERLQQELLLQEQLEAELAAAAAEEQQQQQEAAGSSGGGGGGGSK